MRIEEREEACQALSAFIPSTIMLPAVHRLKKVRDFNLLMQYGRYAKSGELTIRYLGLEHLPQETLPKNMMPETFRKQLKCAFSVGLKVSKKAVERNRLRRRLREIVRRLVQDKALRTGAYVLFVGSKPLLKAPSTELAAMVHGALRQARLMT